MILMARLTYSIRKATESDHDTLVKIAKTSKYTKDFSNRMMFSGPTAYEKGWIKVAVLPGGEILGFSCVRHKVRAPETMLYFITITPERRSEFIGQRLLEEVMKDSPHKTMSLNVMKDNRAVSFYKRLGFRIVSDAMQGQAHRMSKEYDFQHTDKDADW